MTKNTWIVVAALFLSTGCEPDTSEARDVCTQVVNEALDTCTEKAWDLCTMSYEQVMLDLKRENDALRNDIAALANSCHAGCGDFCYDQQNQWLHDQGCSYEAQTNKWVCNGGPLCEQPAP